MKLSTSYLSIKNDKEIVIKKIETTTTDYLHVDIMDGKFVSNQTEEDTLQYTWLCNHKKPLDIHLMVENVKEYIEKYKTLSPEFITFHVELNHRMDIPNIVNELHKQGIGVGLSLKPDTNIEMIEPYLDMIDLVLVMSVEPGRGGQSFLSSSLEKIKRLKELQKDYHFLIEIDGGINNKTSLLCKEAGADMIVVGSYITNSDDYQQQIDQLHL